MEILTTNHPFWNQFVERLDGPEGCHFQERVPGQPDSVTWKCGGGRDKSLATAILETMPNIDVFGTLEYFEDNGGFCDCEILFNVNRADE